MRYPLYLLLAGLLNACAAQTVSAPVGDRSARPARNPDFHTVRQGDTLYSVAFLYGYEVEQLAAWNGLQAPYTIYKGQRLRLQPPPPRSAPHARPKPRPAVVRVSPSRPKPQQVAPSRPKAANAPRPAVPAPAPKPSQAHPPPPPPAAHPAPSADGPLAWSWPAEGPLLQRFDAASSGKKGISIGGNSGASVHAAAAGKVVYSGSGLAGYGRLIIIKHNKDYLSAYAHNRILIATEGQWVEQDQVIAEMGNSGTDRVQLYFEIRKQGRPVDPLEYLPRR
jgi:lipoprotein NlpD